MSGDRRPSPYGWELAFAWCPTDLPLASSGAPGDLSDPPADTGAADQDAVTRRYDRIAGVYDLLTGPMEWAGGARRRRRLLWRATGRVLEAGIGTGKNLHHYRGDVRLTGIDISPNMLRRARRRVMAEPVTLIHGDVTILPYPDDTFDTTVATCVFCSIADPVGGLRELGRVTRPDGTILLLEHVRPTGAVAGRLADLLTPVTRRLFGFRANRNTEANVATAGLTTTEIRRGGVWREIVARPARAP